MSYVEAQTWKAYRESCGSFNISTRLEQGFALIAMMLNRVNGGKAEISDFIPDRGNNIEPPEGSIEDVMALLNSVSAK